MKKIFLLLPLIVCACAEQKAIQTAGASFDIQKIGHSSEKIRNEKCADIQKYKIFQVMNDGALAFACVETCLGLVAFVPKKKGQTYYDDMIVEPSDGQCIAYEGTYRYPIKDGRYKTVPKIKYIGS